MKALLVTSAVTFVPENYNPFINAMADNQNIGGLLIINNRSWTLLLKAFRLVCGYAPLLGRTLLNNHRSVFNKQRQKIYQQAGKPVWYADSVNCEFVHTLIKANRFSLVINARTRCIYDGDTLSLPRLGCINIHHGLLPQQRGTLCDLWALTRGQTAGFSIHKMSEQLDDGELLRVVTTSQAKEHNYLEYLARSCLLEADTLKQILNDIAVNDAIIGSANIKPAEHRYDKDPTYRQFRSLKHNAIEV